MKKRMLLVLAIGLMLNFIAVDTFGRGPRNNTPRHPQRVQPHHPRPGNSVGAPLDGGILTILLGGAGVAYFAAKRKKNAAK